MITLERLLKDDGANAGVEVGSKWLFWSTSEWVVLHRRYGAKQNTCLYRGESLTQAIKELL